MTGPSQSTRDRVLGCHKDLSLFKGAFLRMVIVLCNDSEIEVEDGVVCKICGLELEGVRPGDWHRDSRVLSLDMRCACGVEYR